MFGSGMLQDRTIIFPLNSDPSLEIHHRPTVLSSCIPRPLFTLIFHSRLRSGEPLFLITVNRNGEEVEPSEEVS